MYILQSQQIYISFLTGQSYFLILFKSDGLGVLGSDRQSSDDSARFRTYKISVPEELRMYGNQPLSQ